MKTDIDLLSEMDVKWLLDNGWTIRCNLAYRRILEQRATNDLERIEQILMQYECDENDYLKIQETLKELIQLKNDLLE